MIGITTTFVSALALAAVSTTPAIAGESADSSVHQTYEQVADYSAEQKNEAVTWTENRVAELDRKMDQLDHKISDAGDAMAEKWKEIKADLAVKREQVADGLENMKESTAEAWEEAKAGMVETMQDLERSIEDATEEFDGK
jgi:hypothetical protein